MPATGKSPEQAARDYRERTVVPRVLPPEEVTHNHRETLLRPHRADGPPSSLRFSRQHPPKMLFFITH